MAAAQQYCLRWNNHRTNFINVFEELLRSEIFTDVTLACEGGVTIKCHKVVLAACSSYFQTLFTDAPSKDPIVIIKDVKHSELSTILEYMYRGEVNVAQEQLAALLKVAEYLEVKGLVEENRSNRDRDRCLEKEEHPMEHSPSITTSNPTMSNPVHSSNNSSPHHLSYRNHYNSYATKPQESRMNLPIWAGLPLPPHPASVPNPSPTTSSMLSGCYDSASSDMSPLKRKKLSSLLMNRDTPILRTVLGQAQADSSQPVSLVCHPENEDRLNGNDDRLMKHIKNEPSEDAQSPYTNFTPMNHEEDQSKLAIPSTSPQTFSHEMRGVSSGIATYVPSQKPEWKRYKQYTRNDIMAAIEAVKNGMSALQAAKSFKVPSRTLYDKVKKLGITTSRPFKRGTNGSSNCFPYNAASSYGGHLTKTDEGSMNNNSAMMEASSFLQHALDSRGGDEREALAAMAAAAAAAHAVASGHSTSPNNQGRARSPSPSPTMLKYMRHNSLTPSPAPGSDHHNSHSETNGSSERDHEDDEDQVEDLSINRKESRESTRVIMPPMNQISAIMKKEELLIDSIKAEARRMNLECEGE
ncbi:BTB/POZ domain-containing protein ribbon [Leptinotarsa decemlineata]|uniref:BTB/POZ domain-containing protein ribbon n=1 Tax=Leptinotarsa decemlineata TaxID=7539 RepID=UPI003D3078D0